MELIFLIKSFKSDTRLTPVLNDEQLSHRINSSTVRQ